MLLAKSCTWLLLFFVKSFAMEGIVRTLTGRTYPHVGNVESCVDESYAQDGRLEEAKLNYPWGIAYDKAKGSIYVADCGCPETQKDNDKIRRIDMKAGRVTTVAGSNQGHRDGKGQDARFAHTAGMVLDQVNQRMYIADSGNDVIRVMNLENNEVETFAGKANQKGFVDGTLRKARFDNPQQLELHESTTRLFIADTDNHAIRYINMKGTKRVVETITGGPSKQGFKDGPLSSSKWYHPTGIAYDIHKDVLYVSDHYNHAIRVIDLKKQFVSTIAGKGEPGALDGSISGGPFLNYPEGIVHDPHNNVLYFAEFSNNCIRMLSLSDGSLHVLAGGQVGSRDAVGSDAQFYHPTCIDLDPVNKILYVTDQYNHEIRTVTALGNTEIAHPNYMILNHLGNRKAYTDILVHRPWMATRAFYVVLLVLGLAVIFCLRRKIVSPCRNRFSFSYAKLGRNGNSL